MSLDPDDKTEISTRLSAMSGPVLGLAVSGGGDSMALLALAVDWAKESGRQLQAITIDHGLRPEAAGEAQRVAAFASEFGVPHETLEWQGWDGAGNLQDAARRARASLIGDWARERGIVAVATGHTRDDQAETLLMRLARGSGVDGLSAMAPVRVAGDMTWHRPLLDVSRATLRDYLAAEGLPWIDDPSNEDTRFDRVRARHALEVLGDLGITREGLAATAARMGRARAALEQATSDLLKQTTRLDRGDALVDWTVLGQAPEEIRNRAIAHVIMWVTGAEYKPRASALDHAIEAMETRKTHVLSGCQMSAEGSARRFAREYAAVRDMVRDLGGLWDGRWIIRGPQNGRGTVRALGDDGIRACPDWRESGMPRVSLLASPSVWQGERLVAAPLAGFGRGWVAELAQARQFLV